MPYRLRRSYDRNMCNLAQVLLPPSRMVFAMSTNSLPAVILGQLGANSTQPVPLQQAMLDPL